LRVVLIVEPGPAARAGDALFRSDGSGRAEKTFERAGIAQADREGAGVDAGKAGNA
jgi:hypothetical protein